MYEIGEASLCRGVTRPDWTVSAAGSPRPVTGESNGPSPSVTGSRLLSVAAARYRVGIFFSTPGPGRAQEVRRARPAIPVAEPPSVQASRFSAVAFGAHRRAG